MSTMLSPSNSNSIINDDHIRHLDSKDLATLNIQSVINFNTSLRNNKKTTLQLLDHGNDDSSITSLDYTTKSKFNYSVQSCESVATKFKRLTLKEALFEIENNAKNDKPPPEYVPPCLDEIPVELFQWDKKLPKPLPKVIPDKYSKRRKYFSNKPSKQYKLKYVSKSGKIKSSNKSCSDNQSLTSSLASTGSYVSIHNLPHQQHSDDVSVMSQETLCPGNGGIDSFDSSSVLKRDNTLPRLLNNRTMNIIGCQQPVELILAKANHRSRIRNIKLLKYAQENELKRDNLLKSIDFRGTIQERMRQKEEKENNQKSFMKYILLTQAIQNIQKLHSEKCKGIIERRKYIRRKFRLTVKFILWYQRHMFQKLKDLRNTLATHGLKFYLNITIRLKRRAVSKLITFLEDAKKSVKVSLIVRHYLLCVRKVQRLLKDFLAIRKDRVNLLVGLFNKIEAVYIKEQLSDDSVLSKINPSLFKKKKNNNNDLLKQQEQKWNLIDEKMNKVLGKHQTMGTAKRIVTNDSVQSLALPYSVKRKALQAFIAKKRREYLLNQESEFKKFLFKRSQFNTNDAMEMLNMSNIKEFALGRQDMAGSLVLIRSKLRVPFLLYTGVATQQISQFRRSSSIVTRRNSEFGPVGTLGTGAQLGNLTNNILPAKSTTTGPANTNSEKQQKSQKSKQNKALVLDRQASTSSVASSSVVSARGPNIHEQIKRLVVFLHKENDTFNKYRKTLYTSINSHMAGKMGGHSSHGPPTPAPLQLMKRSNSSTSDYSSGDTGRSSTYDIYGSTSSRKDTDRDTQRSITSSRKDTGRDTQRSSRVTNTANQTNNSAHNSTRSGIVANTATKTDMIQSHPVDL